MLLILIELWLAGAPVASQETQSQAPGNNALQGPSVGREPERGRNGPRRPQMFGQERPRDFSGFGGPGFGGSGYGGPPYFMFQVPREAVRRGFVFLDGEYLPPPYELELTEKGLAINGRELTCLPPSRYDGGRGPGPRGGEREGSWRRTAVEIHSQLSQGWAVVAFREQPLWLLDSASAYELLKSMTTTEGRALRRVALQDKLPSGFDRALWERWIDEFAPPEELLERAVSTIVAYEANDRKAQAEIASARLVQQIEYPLTVCGMVVTVLAIGHLLGGRPHAGRSTQGTDESPEMIRTLNWSLAFAAALSAFDLAWTLMAASTGQLRELNPIGSHLVENPRHLAGFKIAVTVAAIGVLWLLRRHKRAQLAAWWICLLLTLVTIRWLAFSSMFLPSG